MTMKKENVFFRLTAIILAVFLLGILVGGCGAEAPAASGTQSGSETGSELTREQKLSGVQTAETISESLTEEGEANWTSWAEKLLNENYIREQINLAQERSTDETAEHVADWNSITGQDGFYRQAIYEIYGEAGTTLYDLLADVCYLFLLDPAAAKYSVFEDYVKEQAQKADATASVIAPPVEASNPYYSDNSQRLLPVPVGDLDENAVEEVFSYFLADNPQYYFVGTHGMLRSLENEEFGIDLYTYAIYKDGPRYQEIWDAVENARAEYHGADWDSLSEIEKYRRIYDWLAEYVEYDYFAAGMVATKDLIAGFKDSYMDYVVDYEKEYLEPGQNYTADPDYSFSQTAWSVLVREVPSDYPIVAADGTTPVQEKDRPTKYYTVCAGYASAYALLCSLEGLNAIYFSGGGHAWNRAEIDGTWYNMDCTWDDPGETGIVPDGLYVTYMYFARSDEKFYDSHDIGTEAINKYVLEEFPGTKDYPPYEHFYCVKKDTKEWVHGYFDENKLIYLEENEKPKRDVSGAFKTVNIFEDIEGEIASYMDIPGYETHDDSVYKGSGLYMGPPVWE